MTHMIHVGLDKHLQEQPEDKEINVPVPESTNISNKSQENNEKIPAQKDEKGSQPPQMCHKRHMCHPQQLLQNNSNVITATALIQIAMTAMKLI